MAWGDNDPAAKGSWGDSDPVAVAPKPMAKTPTDPVTYVTGLMANVNRGMGIGDEMAAGFATAGDVVTGKTAPSDVVQGFQSNMAKQRQTEDQFRADHRTASNLALGTGNALTAAIPGGKSVQAFAEAPRVVNALRGAVAGGATAAAYGAADRGTAQERLQAASEGATNPLALGLGAVGGALGPAARGKPKISQDVIDLREKGVQLTPGQMRGGLAKAAEDAATSLPILGTSIQEARTAGMESFNHAAANEALAPVGKTVPDHIPAGHDTVAHVEKTLGDLYNKTIPNKTVTIDPEAKASIGERLADITQDMTDASKKRLASILDNRVIQRLGAGETMTGELYQKINSELNTVKGRYGSSQDPDHQAVAEAVTAVQEELRNAAARQDPAFATAKAAIDKGWASFKRLQGAAASLGAEAGVFTPAQYGGAVRRADRSVDKGATARGGAMGQGLANSGRAVLPNKVPDSGTATRGMIGTVASAPGALIAGGVTGGPVGVAGVAAGYAATLGSLKAAARAYAPEAVALANKALDVRISKQQAQQAVSDLGRLASQDPRLKQLYQHVAQGARTGAVAAESSGTVHEININKSTNPDHLAWRKQNALQ